MSNTFTASTPHDDVTRHDGVDSVGDGGVSSGHNTQTVNPTPIEQLILDRIGDAQHASIVGNRILFVLVVALAIISMIIVFVPPCSKLRMIQVED